VTVVPLGLEGVLRLEPVAYPDDRGWLIESWSERRCAEIGLPRFVQDNVSRSGRGVLRGLHLQHPRGQGKLVSVLQGRVWDVAVDVRRGSPTFGRWVAATLSDEDHHQLWIPAGFAHGFCVLSDAATVHYRCTDVYAPEDAVVIAWDDPDLAIPWPVRGPRLSPLDAAAPRLADVPASRLPER
jgi:dTDP-4-dehydrorhamnose 3,5-epimerase